LSPSYAGKFSTWAKFSVSYKYASLFTPGRKLQLLKDLSYSPVGPKRNNYRKNNTDKED
jgi:hypothetical protein